MIVLLEKELNLIVLEAVDSLLAEVAVVPSVVEAEAGASVKDLIYISLFFFVNFIVWINSFMYN